ncbi:MAG: TRAP transporter small permease [Deltaproteobacteria bacterium]|nr:TRAP transporter small permease [Deltaproteobacteria bacterium]
MVYVERFIYTLANRFNWIAAAAVVVIMLLTTADVVLRLFRHPIPGTYEIVGFMGTVIISFSLAYTSIQKGHIAVDFIVQKLPRKSQLTISAVNDLMGSILFGIIAWQSIAYAIDLKQSHEVSLTIQIPIYPFALGIAIGCGLLCLVLLAELITSIKRITVP